MRVPRLFSILLQIFLAGFGKMVFNSNRQQKTKKKKKLQMKALLAKSKATGLYFNGTSFSESDYRKAMHLRPGTTSEDFWLAWAGEVIVEERVFPSGTGMTLAQRIHNGEITPEVAARLFIREQQRETGQKSFMVFVRFANKWVSRVPRLPKTQNMCAYIHFAGNECALVWRNGELQTGW